MINETPARPKPFKSCNRLECMRSAPGGSQGELNQAPLWQTQERSRSMTGASRVRIWVETIIGLAAAVLAIVTIFWKDWLEAVFGWDPDRHSGSTKWLIVLSLAVLAAILLPLARWERRRMARLGRSPSPSVT
jgi:hypothetical protein